MFGNNGRNGFALGLVAGLCVAIIAMLAVESAPNGFQRTTEQVRRASVDANANQQETYQEGNALARWARRIVSLEDTSAQWLMTIFSILAAFLLWRTLRATQAMAADARDIGESAARAYFTFDTVQVVYYGPVSGPSLGIILRPYVKNTGNSPARVNYLTSDARAIVGPPPETFKINALLRMSSSLRIGAGGTIYLSGGMIGWEDAERCIAANGALVVGGRVDFTDVFGKQFSEEFCVRVTFNGPLGGPELDQSSRPGVEWRILNCKVITEQ